MARVELSVMLQRRSNVSGVTSGAIYLSFMTGRTGI